MTHAYHSLLMEYASGCLDEAHALIVAAHISLSAQGRSIVMRYESVGGALIDECAPVAMTGGAFASLMARVEEEEGREKVCTQDSQPCEKGDLPTCIQAYLRETVTEWIAAGPGVALHILPTLCRESDARLVRIAPAVVFEISAADTEEILLILEGAVHDGTQSYCRGEMAIVEAGFRAAFAGRTGGETLCLLVRPGERCG